MMKRYIAVVCLLGVHLLVALLLAHHERIAAQDGAVRRVGGVLTRVVAATGEANWCLGRARRLASALLALHPAQVAGDDALLPRVRRELQLAERAVEIYLFDRTGALVTMTPRHRGSSAAARRANTIVAGAAVDYFTQIRQPWWRSPTDDLLRLRRFRLLLGETRRWHHPIARPDRLIRVNAFPRRAWCYWQFNERATAEQVAGVMVLFNRHRIDRERPLTTALAQLARRGWAVGRWHRAVPGATMLPPGAARPQVAHAILQYLREPRAELRCGDGRLVVAPCRENQLLLALVALPPLRLPAWQWGILLLWLPLALMPAWSPARWRVSLRTLLLITLLVAAGIPLGLTGWFWKHFSDSRRASIAAGLCQDLESALVDADQRFPTTLRDRREFYRGLTRSLLDPIARPGIVSSTYALELQGLFDTMFIVSSQGAMLRDFCTSAIEVRRWALRPPRERLQALQDHFARGLLANPGEVGAILSFDPGSQPLSLLTGLKPADASEVPVLVAQIARELIGQHDREHGLAPPEHEPAGDVSTLVLGSVMETQGGNIAKMLGSYRGDFLHLGHEQSKSYLFTDIVADREGRGQFCVIAFHNQQTLERLFFENLYAGSGRWPTGLQVFAVSSYDLVTNFPSGREWRRFRRLESLLQPPRRLWSGVTRADGRPVLLAGLACRYPDHYVLAAVRSLDEVDRRMRLLTLQLAGLAVALTALTLFIATGLGRVAVTPAQALVAGIRAMEDKRFDYRVITCSGDEWQDLATTFNETLVGMEELEVARIVQARLLPAGAITASPWTFLGRTVSMGQVGGDYYDARPLSDGSLMFVIGDVAGHGVSAALVVAMAKAAFNLLVREGVHTPSAVLAAMNQLLFDQLQRAKMMTGVVGLARADGTLTLALAGHTAPYLLVPGQKPRQQRQASVPLGISGKARYQDLNVAPGQTPVGCALVLYTDGIVEATSPQGEALGYTRLEQLLAGLPTGAGEPLIAGIHEGLRHHTGGSLWQDDVTVAVLWRQ